MSTPTKTIRVGRTTHDSLAEIARERGISMAALLGEFAAENQLRAIWQAEHAASTADRLNPAVAGEVDDGETTLGDGVG